MSNRKHRLSCNDDSSKIVGGDSNDSDDDDTNVKGGKTVSKKRNATHAVKKRNTNRTIVEFDVGGRIFKVRRSLLDSFPETMLARSAADIWNTKADVPSQHEQSEQEPIFIDRDSNRFSYILDYMRDGCVVTLPLMISKESFITDLEYFGFDESTIITDNITCTIPVFEAVMQIDHLHSTFSTRVKNITLERDCIILAYACFCECVRTRKSICHFHWTTPFPLKLVSSDSSVATNCLNTTVSLLINDYKHQHEQTSIDNILVFNNCLVEYGLQCTSMKHVTRYSQSTVEIKLKSNN